MTTTDIPTSAADLEPGTEPTIAGLESKIDVLTRQLAVLTADVEARQAQRRVFTELTADVTGISDGAVALVTDRLARAEERGYFGFARAGAGVVDRVVTGFDERELDQLGDNVVTILETVKEITQPEMLALLAQMVDAVKRQQERVDAEPIEAPSLWALAKSIRHPDVRRAIARALGTLRAVSVETGPADDGPKANTTNTGTNGGN
ncbi:MAG: DUF1641 domain-containing protein [Acidimicrobiales bacterium]